MVSSGSDRASRDLEVVYYVIVEVDVVEVPIAIPPGPDIGEGEAHLSQMLGITAACSYKQTYLDSGICKGAWGHCVKADEDRDAAASCGLLLFALLLGWLVLVCLLGVTHVVVCHNLTGRRRTVVNGCETLDQNIRTTPRTQPLETYLQHHLPFEKTLIKVLRVYLADLLIQERRPSIGSDQEVGMRIADLSAHTICNRGQVRQCGTREL